MTFKFMTEEEIIAENKAILSKARLVSLDVVGISQSNLCRYECENGHITLTRIKEIKSQLKVADPDVCAECRAVKKKDYPARQTTNTKIINRQLEKYPNVSLVSVEIPARKNAVIFFNCETHGEIATTVREIEHNAICKQCAIEGDIQTMSPIEAYLKNNHSWRNKYHAI